MRTFAIMRFGEAPAIHDLPPPEPDGRGDFLVRVACAGVNPIDFKRVDALTADAKFPHVLGIDFAGVVELAPPGDHGFRVGDRVFGMARRHGTFAERTLASLGAQGEALAHIPDRLSFQQAAVLPVAGVAAAGGLQLLGIGPGRKLAIVGAAGGVGGYAIQLAVARGARVVAVVRGHEEEARRLGAHEVLDATAGEPFARIAAACPGGVDAVLDLVSDGDAIVGAADVLVRGGTLVSALRSADEWWFAARGITANNISAPGNPSASRRGLEALAASACDGGLTTRVLASADLDHAADVLDRVRAGGLRGKAVIMVGA